MPVLSFLLKQSCREGRQLRWQIYMYSLSNLGYSVMRRFSKRQRVIRTTEFTTVTVSRSDGSRGINL